MSFKWEDSAYVSDDQATVVTNTSVLNRRSQRLRRGADVLQQSLHHRIVDTAVESANVGEAHSLGSIETTYLMPLSPSRKLIATSVDHPAKMPRVSGTNAPPTPSTACLNTSSFLDDSSLLEGSVELPKVEGFRESPRLHQRDCFDPDGFGMPNNLAGILSQTADAASLHGMQHGIDRCSLDNANLELTSKFMGRYECRSQQPTCQSLAALESFTDVRAFQQQTPFTDLHFDDVIMEDDM